MLFSVGHLWSKAEVNKETGVGKRKLVPQNAHAQTALDGSISRSQVLHPWRIRWQFIGLTTSPASYLPPLQVTPPPCHPLTASVCTRLGCDVRNYRINKSPHISYQSKLPSKSRGLILMGLRFDLGTSRNVRTETKKNNHEIKFWWPDANAASTLRVSTDCSCRCYTDSTLNLTPSVR
ncbi:hypothetical protein J6590_078428 [Homalodisca vitripennis]|nr:hypothetical protein J6590_078428 [Homalodisca vitripennis]